MEYFSFFSQPYALFRLMTKQSIFFMLAILAKEQQNYYVLYDKVKMALENTARNSMNIFRNSFEEDGCRDLVYFTKKILFLYFGGLFLVALKAYILFRHMNYMIFAIVFYWCNMFFNNNERIPRNLQELEDQD